ncbi:MAG: glucose 1-dehydrogenase [Waddliaceae bacterium]
MRDRRLKGKVALITGAAQGIGKATALAFVSEGAQVIITDINDEAGRQVVEEIGSRSSYLHLDVRNESDWSNAIDYILREFKQLDIVVNNAGITGFYENAGPQDPENASLESWREVHAVNNDGTFLGCKYAIYAMKQTGGAIVNVSSRSGLVGIPGAAAYAASKAAIRNHTKTVALYCCQQNYPIRCNSVHPAAILTPMWEPMLGTGQNREEVLQEISRDIPMKKMGSADDVAHAILYLASDEAKYVTGIELSIDGGILAGATAAPKKVEAE